MPSSWVWWWSGTPVQEVQGAPRSGAAELHICLHQRGSVAPLRAAPRPRPAPQIVERLTERRIAVEKAVTTLGEAPSGLRDVFELCRGFERAFSNIVNVRARARSRSTARTGAKRVCAAAGPRTPPAPACAWPGARTRGGGAPARRRLATIARAQESPAANKIKEAFFSERGLAGNVQKLPLEKVFEIESVKKVRPRRARAPRARASAQAGSGARRVGRPRSGVTCGARGAGAAGGGGSGRALLAASAARRTLG